MKDNPHLEVSGKSKELYCCPKVLPYVRDSVGKTYKNIEDLTLNMVNIISAMHEHGEQEQQTSTD